MKLTSTLTWQKAIITPTANIQDAARNLTESALKLALVVDSDGKLVGTISDGDIRRGLLRGLTFESPVSDIIRRNPLVVPQGVPVDVVRKIMLANKIQQVPEIDEHNHLVNLHLWDDFESPVLTDVTMVVMAGGKGERLRPYTENCPKPMLLVHGKPMLEHIIYRAKTEGFHRFIISVNYLSTVIEDYFKDGETLGIQIEYLRESSPLGTAGALSLLDKPLVRPLVVINGDVISDINYGDLFDFHERQSADATMAIKLHEWQHPYGVVQIDGVKIVGFEEKPVARTHINAGVYVLSPSALRYLQKNEACDMPTLFNRLQSAGKRTVAYPMHEPWLDVGRPQDLSIANSINKQSEK